MSRSNKKKRVKFDKPISHYANGGQLAPDLIGGSALLGADLVETFSEDSPQRINKQKIVGTSLLKGAGGGAQLGGTIGGMILPGLGHIIGAGAGAILGGTGGALLGNKQANKEIQENHDALMETYYGDNPSFYPNPSGTSFADGGRLPEFTHYEGNSHEEGGIPLNNKNAEVEDGETRVKNYVFSDRLTVPGKNLTFSEYVKRIEKKYKGRENDLYSKKSLNKELEELMSQNEAARIAKKEAYDQLDPEYQSVIKRYGGSIKYENGGYLIDDMVKGELSSLASKNKMSLRKYAKNIYENYEPLQSEYGISKKNKMQHGGPIGPPTYEQFLHNSPFVTTYQRPPVVPGVDGMNPLNQELISDLYFHTPYSDLQEGSFDGRKTKFPVPEPLSNMKGTTTPELYFHNPTGNQWGSEVTIDPNKPLGPPDDPFSQVMDSSPGPVDDFGSKIQLPPMRSTMGPPNIGDAFPGELPIDKTPLTGDRRLPTNYQRLSHRPLDTTSNVSPDNSSYKTSQVNPNTGLPEETGGIFQGSGPVSNRTNNFYKELGLLNANLPTVSNLIRSMVPEQTNFKRVKPKYLNNEEQRLLARKQAAITRSILGETVRSAGKSSGEVLSTLSAGHSTISEQLGQQLLQSKLQEKTYNTQLDNQVNQMNTQISNQEFIANEQNRAQARNIGAVGISDMSLNNQKYFRDLGLTEENDRFNNQVLSIINQMFPEYQWGQDPESDKMRIQFVMQSIGK